MNRTDVTFNPTQLIFDQIRSLPVAHTDTPHITPELAPMSEVIWESAVYGRVEHADRDAETLLLDVQLKWEERAANSSQRVLLLRLTATEDPLFLYTTKLSEEDFHHLKSEQEILLDFAAFPSMLIELFERVRGNESGQADTSVRGITDTPTPHTPSRREGFCLGIHLTPSKTSLRLQEITSYKIHVHLQLALVRADDATLKRALASRLQSTQQQLHATVQLKMRLEDENQELSHQLREKDSSHSTEQHNLEVKIRELQETMQHAQDQWSRDQESERSQLEASWQRKMAALEAAGRAEIANATRNTAEALERSRDQLRAALLTATEAESALSHLRPRVDVAEARGRQLADQCQQLQQQLDESVRSERATLAQLQLLREKQARWETETEMRDAEMKATKDAAIRGGEQEKQSQETIRQLTRQLQETEDRARQQQSELERAASLLQQAVSRKKQLQQHCSSLEGALLQQEAHLQEKEGHCRSLEQQNTRTTSEIHELQSALKAAQADIAAAQEALKKDSKVIAYLNSQIQEATLQKYTGGNASLNLSSTSTKGMGMSMTTPHHANTTTGNLPVTPVPHAVSHESYHL